MSKKRIVRHILFWIAWLLSMSLFYGYNPKNNLFFQLLLSLGISLPVYAGYTYLSVYFLVPRTILKGKLPAFFLLILLISLLVSLIERAHMNFVYFRYFSPRNYKAEDWFSIHEIVKNMVWVNVPLVMFASIKYIRGYSLEQSRKNELESKNLQAELSLLMFQLRPHFLFNTLNNLYSLALAGSEKTYEGLQKILGLLKYILYECNEDFVRIDKEINLIENYVDLEKIRYDERLVFNFTREIADPSFRIIPMVLFTFVENSFKHGSSKDSGNSFINIYLSTTEDKLVFTAENSVPDVKTLHASTGLGLLNVKKRLELIYPGNHHLDITKRDKRFSVSLTINKKE